MEEPELARVRSQLESLASMRLISPLTPGERARFEELGRRERELLGLVAEDDAAPSRRRRTRRRWARTVDE